MDTLSSHAPNGNVHLKHCAACNNDLPATPEFFHRYAKSKDGLQARCKSCVSKHGKEYRDIPNVRDRRRSRRREYKKRPAEQQRRREYARAYWRRPEILARYSTPRYSHEQRTAYYREYIHRPLVKAKRSVHAHNRRARLRATSGRLTVEQIQHKLKAQHYSCYYCFAKFEKRNNSYVYHLEHTIPLSRVESIPRHDVNYVVLSCPSCNRKKHDKLPHEWAEGGRLL